MYCTYQDREGLEDDLYQEDEGDSEGSEANSELEFRLYSQLHYSSNAGEVEELECRGEQVEGQNNQELEVTGDAVEELEYTVESGPPSPSLSNLEQHLKKKKKSKENKLNKLKKKITGSKGQKLSTSIFEEVVVIDSSPDVISISEDDTDDDDEGVCTLKGKGFQHLQSSTPAQQENQKRKWSLTTPVTVDLISSESDSEESESKPESKSYESYESSDSEGVENWMILGQGNQDGDQSISLNLVGGSDRSADAVEEVCRWLVSDKDKEAQIFNKDRGPRIAVQRVLNRYYTDKKVYCRNCNNNGHLSKNCLEPKKLLPCFLCGTPGHIVSECPNKHCNNCGQPGHLYESCRERAHWHKKCHRCSITGHYSDACPEIWRQYHITTKAGPPAKQRGEDNGRSPAYCYNCSRKGHFGHVCTKQKMFGRMYLNTPFINHYDTVQDIKHRQHKIKLKVKELKKNGYFPTMSQVPLTPGPPKKKQKISHDKNNYQLNHMPHQKSKNHKPSPSHVFFIDSDFKAATHKMNKYNKYKHQESTGNVKPWKPKRSVPISRDPRPPNKLILDEADDFPRGGGKGDNLEKQKKKKFNKKAKNFRHSRPDNLSRAEGANMQSVSKQNGETKKKRNRARRTGDNKPGAPMYPTDENLFIIKQRKRSR